MNRQGKDKIEYLNYTFNPVTGCLHPCKDQYCYAKKIANRFGHNSIIEACMFKDKPKIYDLHYPVTYSRDYGHDLMGNPVVKDYIDPYPAGFAPTFHRYRLDEPTKKKQPSIIGVVYMGDLFGEWVPDEWIEEVFKACEEAPQHTYMYLTKNPERYAKFAPLIRKNYWIGFTNTYADNDRMKYFGYAHWLDNCKKFVSIEPLLGEPTTFNHQVDWVIIGQQTGTGAVPPKSEWVQSIIEQCRAAAIPVFVKNPLYEQFPIQEWPDGLDGKS